MTLLTRKSAIPVNTEICTITQNDIELGMSSLFINLILKTSHYLHMEVLNERITGWVHLYFYHKQFLRYLHLKFEKEVIFLERFSPYEITEISEFSKLLFK